MKRILLTITALLALAPLAAAQQESAVAVETGYLLSHGSSAIIRNWQDEESVSIHGAKGGYRIVKTKFATLCATTGAPSNTYACISDPIVVPYFKQLDIYDMKILGDMAYFCGSVNDPPTSPLPLSRGVLGCFKVQSLNTSSVDVTIHVFDSTRWFRRLVAFEDTSGKKVVAIGQLRIQSTTPFSHQDIVVFDDFTPGLSSCTAEQVSAGEYFCDIVLTSNYIAIVGYDALNDGRIVIRRADRNSSPISFSNQTLYSGLSEVNNTMCATHLQNDEIAFAYTYMDPVSYQRYMRMRVVNVNNHNMVSSQQIPIVEKYDPIDISYDSIDDILTVMHPMPFNDSGYPNNYTYFIKMKPYFNVNYLSNILYPVIGEYTSLDRFRDIYYVSAGSSCWYFQHVTAPPPVLDQCPVIEMVQIQAINNQTTALPPSTDPLWISHHSILINIPVQSTQLNLNCKE